MHVLVGCCFSVVRKVQLVCSFVLGTLVSSKTESYNTKVVDNALLYPPRKFHVFLDKLFVYSKNVKQSCCYVIGYLVAILRETMA
jgi:hypothetical protein